MAAYSPGEASVFAREFVKGVPISSVDFLICDMIQSIMWDFYVWNFTIKQKLKVNDTFLTDGAQDLSGIPTDFYRLICLHRSNDPGKHSQYASHIA